MKKILSIILASALVLSLSTTALASNASVEKSVGANTTAMSNTGYRIQREDLEAVIGKNYPVMSPEDAEHALNLIDEKSDAEQLVRRSTDLGLTRASVSKANTRIAAIEEELAEIGAIPLTTEDVYAILGDTYRPGAPSEPSDTARVKFYSLTSYHTVGGKDYEVYSIVAYSAGMPETDDPYDSVSTIMALRDSVDLFPRGDYSRSHFDSEFITLAISAAEFLFEDAFDEIPILTHLGTIWNIATFLGENSSQAITQQISCLYAAQQTFVYSYVAESDVGYFDFMQTAERIAGFFQIDTYRYVNATPSHGALGTHEWEVFSDHYADYANAVQLYRQNFGMQYGYRVDDIDIVIYDEDEDDYSTKETISMYYYNSLANIPGI